MSSNNDSFASCSTSTSNEPLDLEQLIRRCCDCFEGDPAEPEPKLPEWLFACSEWLTTDLSELMALFVALFQNNPSDYGHRVCSAVSYWIRHFPAHFDGNPQLCRVLSRLKRLAAADQSAVPRPLVEELLDISAIPSYAWLRNPSTRNPVSRHVSLCFEQWTAEDIATSMSHIDHKALSRISVSELKHYVKLGRLSGLCPHLERSITVFNCFSGWVQATILSKPSAAERAEVITKFVQVARHLRRQSNFNTLMAVIGGVKHSNIDRLAQTRALLRLEVAEQLDALTELLSYNNNYAKYRRALREVGHRFRIPIMGVHLKDLISFWHSASLEQFERSRQISERCLSQLALLLAHFLSVDRTTPNFGDANLDLINTLKVLFDIRYDEQELYNQSLKREPRGEATSSRQHSSESDQPPAVLADWAKGVCRQPDPHSVDKHIAAMVDAVFKHYDQDRNGCIRKAEFEQFIGNFAFMTAQCPVETGQEGLISRDEMHEFFSRRLNKIRNGLARHQWTDWHFLVPATCAHCNKMLWMRHGTRCSQCALASHEACTLSLNADCSSRSLAGAESGSARPPTESTGLSGWLNASLSPRFATLGPISGSSRFYVNGRADTDRTGVSARQNKGIRRVRTSSSSTSEGSREAIAGSRREERPAPALFNSSGGFRSSFRNLLRTLDSKAKGSRAGSEGTAAATSTEEFEVAGQHQPQEPRASLACEEVFEEDPFTISQQQQQQQQQQTKEDHKGS